MLHLRATKPARHWDHRAVRNVAEPQGRSTLRLPCAITFQSVSGYPGVWVLASKVERWTTQDDTASSASCSALRHRQPDRVPVDLAGHRSSGIAAIAYARLRDHLGLEKRPIRVYDIQQQLAIVDEDVLDRFGVDTIELGRGFALDDARLGRLGPARRHAVPDARLGATRTGRRPLGHSRAVRAG